MTAIQVRDSIKKGEDTGPRLQCANALLTAPKGHAHAKGGVCSGGVDGVREKGQEKGLPKALT